MPNRGIAPPDLTTDVGFVYGLSCTCHPDRGVMYVGQTTGSPRDRLRGHVGDSKRHDTAVARWIRKHGPQNIEVRTLEEVSDVSFLDDCEITWIQNFNSFNDKSKLNLTPGGGSFGRHPQETRDKMRAAWTPERHQKHREQAGIRARALKGRPRPPETRRRISEAKKGYKPSPESIRKARETRAREGTFKGEKNGRSLISGDTARDIYLASWAQFETMDGIAARFGVSNLTVQRIKYRKNWVEDTSELARELFDE